MQETTRNHPPAGASGARLEIFNVGGGSHGALFRRPDLVILVRTNRFSGTGSSPARVQPLRSVARLRIQEVIITSTCRGRLSVGGRLCGNERGYNLRDAGSVAFKCPDRASIGKMGTARKTGKAGVSQSAGTLQGQFDQKPELEAVASDRASYRVIGPEAEGQRLDNYLIRIAKGVPKSHVYRIVRQGEVRVNKGRVAVDYRLAAGDQVRIPPMRLAERASTPLAAVPAAAMPPILFEDEHLLVVDKPAGLAAHGGSGIAFGLIERVRAARPNQPFLELVHRLDRETSGILLLAKSRRALLGLHEDLREGRVEKRYSILVKGDWVNDRQHVRLPLTKYVNRHGERRVSVDAEGMESHTVFSLIRRYGRFSLLEADLKTGRTHQIRVHLSHLGFPIIGDDKYGDFELNKRVARGAMTPGLPRIARMFLHAGATRFKHPVTSRPMALEAPLPSECIEFLKALSAPL
jgi:23S rRNA pseudouridine955/2504/2580 synthase